MKSPALPIFTHFGADIPLKMLFFNTFSLQSSPNVSDNVSEQYRKTGTTIILYTRN